MKRKSKKMKIKRKPGRVIKTARERKEEGKRRKAVKDGRRKGKDKKEED